MQIKSQPTKVLYSLSFIDPPRDQSAPWSVNLERINAIPGRNDTRTIATTTFVVPAGEAPTREMVTNWVESLFPVDRITALAVIEYGMQELHKEVPQRPNDYRVSAGGYQLRFETPKAGTKGRWTIACFERPRSYFTRHLEKSDKYLPRKPTENELRGYLPRMDEETISSLISQLLALCSDALAPEPADIRPSYSTTRTHLS